MRLDENHVASDGQEPVESYPAMANGESSTRVQGSSAPYADFSSTARNGRDRFENYESDDLNHEANYTTFRPSLCPLEEQHQGRAVLNTVIQLPVDAVFNYLFLHKEFMGDVLAARKVSDIVTTPWEEGEDGRRARMMTYTMSLSISSLASKASSVTERQVVQESRAGAMYVVETEAMNAGVPYADAFTVYNHYCLSRDTRGTTTLTVWSNVKYKKAVWGLVKGMLEKNTYNGMEALMAELLSRLEAEAEKVGAPTGRVRRRAHVPRDKNRAHSSSQNMHSPKMVSPPLLKRGGFWIGLVMVALLLLLIANYVLYNKLSRLERLTGLKSSQPGASSHSSLGESAAWETVEKMVSRQEQLQNHQQHIWKNQIEHVSLKLQEVQASLEELLMMVPEHQKNLKHVLQYKWMKVENTLEEQSSNVKELEIE
ncbi:protein Aster-C isoform X3 [Cherax quadricarinatus]|nr:protein Aster-C-like isoform X3 [Cherax quadricarinatus]